MRASGPLVRAVASRRGVLALLVACALPVARPSVAPAQGAAASAPPAASPAAAKGGAAEEGGGFLGKLSLSSSNEPIVVRSDELEFAYQENRVVYRGSVNVVQGDLMIDCKELVVNLARTEEKENLELREVIAIGDVVITQGERKATGGRAIFDQQKRQITLLENPVLHDGPNEVSGERIVVYIDESRSVVESSPKKRVSAILYPGKGGQGVDLAGKPSEPAAGGRP